MNKIVLGLLIFVAIIIGFPVLVFAYLLITTSLGSKEPTLGKIEAASGRIFVGTYNYGYVFDTVTKVFSEKGEVSTDDYLALSPAMQIDNSGNVYTYFRNQTGAPMLVATGKEFSQISRNGELIFKTDTSTGLFRSWVVNREGTKVYILLPSSSKEGVEEHSLIEFDIAKRQSRTIVENVSGSYIARFSADARQLLLLGAQSLSGQAKYTATIVSLEDNKLRSNVFWADTDSKRLVSKVSYYAGGSIEATNIAYPSPDLHSLLVQYYENNMYKLGLVNLKEGGVKEVAKLEGVAVDIASSKPEDFHSSLAQQSPILWSPDSTNFLYAVGAVRGASYKDKEIIPAAQGVYRYAVTEQVTEQILESEITHQIDERNGGNQIVGEVILGSGSYDGSSFIYANNMDGRGWSNPLFYYDLDTRQASKIADNIHTMELMTFRFE